MVSFNLGATYLFSVIRDSMSTSVYGNNVKIFWGLEKLFHSFTFLKMSTQQQMSKWLLCCICCRNSSYKIISQLSKQAKKMSWFFQRFLSVRFDVVTEDFLQPTPVRFLLVFSNGLYNLQHRVIKGTSKRCIKLNRK